MAEMESVPPATLAELTRQDRGPPLIAYCIVFMIIPVVFVALRFWSRAVVPRGEKKFQYDDWFALVCVPFTLVQSGVTIQWVKWGLGKHMLTVPPNQLVDGLKLFYVGSYGFIIGVAITKFSALAFYARVFRPTSRTFRLHLWALAILNAGWMIAATVTLIVRCRPIHKAWDILIPGKCFDLFLWLLGLAVPSVVIDLYILLLPMPIIWRLNVTVVRKIMIGCVFLIGYGIIVASIGRLVSISKAGIGLEDDLTWNFAIPIYWYTCETPISLVCICLPSIFHLVRRGYLHGIRSLFTDQEFILSSKGKYGNGKHDPYGTSTSHKSGNSKNINRSTGIYSGALDGFERLNENGNEEGAKGTGHRGGVWKGAPGFGSKASADAAMDPEDCELGMKGLSEDIPLEDQVYMRKDVDIGHERSWAAI